jgi:hypothetical protein
VEDSSYTGRRVEARITSYEFPYVFHANEDVKYGSWEEIPPAGYGQEAGVRMCGRKEADESHTTLSVVLYPSP